jgi:hypothetical protein
VLGSSAEGETPDGEGLIPGVRLRSPEAVAGSGPGRLGQRRRWPGHGRLASLARSRPVGDGTGDLMPYYKQYLGQVIRKCEPGWPEIRPHPARTGPPGRLDSKRPVAQT